MELFTVSKVFDFLFYAITSIGMWVMKSYADRIKSLESTVLALNLSLPDKYVKKDDMKDLEDRVLTVLNRIEDKLDKKQDK